MPPPYVDELLIKIQLVIIGEAEELLFIPPPVIVDLLLLKIQ